MIKTGTPTNSSSLCFLESLEYAYLPLVFTPSSSCLQGVYGAYFSKLNYHWSKHVRNGTWLGAHPKSEVVLITLITALLSFLNPYTRMGGTELVYNLFAECREGESHGGLCVYGPEYVGPVAKAISVALLVKGCLTIVTFGIKVPAGIFIPTLGVGACAGRILGLGVQWMSWMSPDLWIFESCGKTKEHCVVPGVYAMIGAAATLSGVTVRCFSFCLQVLTQATSEDYRFACSDHV